MQSLVLGAAGRGLRGRSGRLSLRRSQAIASGLRASVVLWAIGFAVGLDEEQCRLAPNLGNPCL